MGWVQTEDGQILLGKKSEALTFLLDTFNELLAKHTGEDTIDILRRIVSGEGINLTKEVEAQALTLAKKYLGAEATAKLEQFNLLRKTLGKVEQLGEDERIFGWPSVKTTPSTKTDNFVLSLEASGGADLRVLAGKEKDGQEKDGKANVAFNLNGKLHPKAALNSNLPISASASAYFSRSVSYTADYDELLRTGRGFVDILGRAGAPLYDFDKVLASFHKKSPMPFNDPDGQIPNPHRSIVYSGAMGADFAFEANVKIPVHGISTKFNLGASAGFDRQFATKITCIDQSTLRVATEFTSKSSKSFAFGAGASVGLNTLAPGFTEDLINLTKDAEDVFDKINSVWTDTSGKISTWLKPGSALEAEINKFLKKELVGNGAGASALKQFLAFITGVDDGATKAKINEAGTKLIAEKIDNALSLFGSSDQNDAIFRDIAQKLVSEGLNRFGLAGEIDKVKTKLDKILDQTSSVFSDKLGEAANALDNAAKDQLTSLVGQDPEGLIGQISEFLKDGRTILNDVVKAVNDVAVEAFAIEFGWRRNQQDSKLGQLSFDVNHDGKDFYKKMIVRTGSAVKQAFEPNGTIDGVNFDDDSSLLEIYEIDETFNWGATILSFKGLGTTKKLAESKIYSGIGGKIVGVGAKGAIEKHTEFAKEGRTIRFNDMLVLGNTGESEPAFTLSLMQKEDNVSFNEPGKFVQDFMDAQLLSDRTGLELQGQMKDARAAINNKKNGGTYSVLLAVPPSDVRNMLNGMSSIPSQKLRELAINALAENSRFAKQIAKKIKLTRRVYGDDLPFTNTDIVRALQNSTWLYQQMKQAEKDAPDVESAKRRPREAKRFWRLTRNLQNGIVGMFAELEKANQDMNDFLAQGQASGSERKKIRKALAKRQKRIIKHLSPWLKTGIPALSDHVPAISASLFRLISDISELASGQRLAAVFELNMDGKQKQLFVCDCE